MDRYKLDLSPSFDPSEVPGWENRFPRLPEAFQKTTEIIQCSGEALFVPSGWHHSVENLEDTISINHNWLNGFNVAWAVSLLCRTFLRAVELLADCRCGLSVSQILITASAQAQHQHTTSFLGSSSILAHCWP
jgi:hypothetical protein